MGFFLAASSGDITKLCGEDGVAAAELEAPELWASSFFSCAQKAAPTTQNAKTANNAFTLSDIVHPTVAQVGCHGKTSWRGKIAAASPVHLSHPV
jgi:hypothetical protein